MVQSMAMISPIIAPVLGAFILKFVLWRGAFFVLFLAGVIGILGTKSSWIFALLLFPASLAGSLMRPPTTNLIIEQQDDDIGSAMSLMSFIYTVMGSIGMLLISLL